MNKNDILDWVMTFENEALEHMKEEVIKTAEFNYGKEGREVAEKYYRQLDGEEEFDDPDIEDCDDCKERALKLIKVADSIKDITDLLTSDLLDKLSNDVNKTILNETITPLLDNIIDKLLQKSCFKLDNEQKVKLRKRLLLDVILNQEG